MFTRSHSRGGALAGISSLLIGFSFVVALAMVSVTVAQGAPVLYIADLDDANDAVGNQSVVDRLELLGHTVTTFDDNQSMTTDPSIFDLVVITSSVLSGDVGTHFTNTAKPVIQWEQALWDELLMSNGGRTIVNSTSINVTNIAHPLAQRMKLTQTGELQIRNAGAEFHVGNTANLAPGATVIAEESGGGAPAIAIVDAGGTLNNGNAAAGMRIMLFHGDPALDGVLQAGFDIFDGAVNHALGVVEGIPGDVNGDEVVDINDYIIIRDNFRTGIGRSEGDLNLDGSVDLVDFRIWRVNAFPTALLRRRKGRRK